MKVRCTNCKHVQREVLVLRDQKYAVSGFTLTKTLSKQQADGYCKIIRQRKEL